MIFIDFDDTIFNTKTFKKKYLDVFIKAGISKELFDRTYYFKNGIDDGQIYHYEKHIQKIEMEIGKSLKETKLELKRFLADTSRFVYRDFWKFSAVLEKEEKTLLSYGCQPFQGIKIGSCGIADVFKNVIVTCGKKSKKIKKIIEKRKDMKKVFFLDDRPDQLEDVIKNIPNIICIRVRRKSGRYYGMKMNDQKIAEVPNLKEAAYLVKRAAV